MTVLPHAPDKGRLAAVVGVLLLAAATGCGGSSTDDYCGAVKHDQKQLSTVVGAGGPTALIDLLPVFRDLRDKAPSDIRKDWATVIDRATALDDALKKAGVDPAKYDAKNPPAGVSATQRQTIAKAATAVGSASTVTALNAVQQQVRDVCQISLAP